MSAAMMRVAHRRLKMSDAMKMQAAMLSAPQALAHLSVITNLAPTTVRYWLKGLQKEMLAHVGGWTEDVRGRMFTPLYAWGSGPDVARAGAARTSAERMRDTRARRKAEQEASA